MYNFEFSTSNQEAVAPDVSGRLFDDSTPDSPRGNGTEAQPQSMDNPPLLAMCGDSSAEGTILVPDDLFNRLDKNKDGRISPEELFAALQDRSFSLKSQEVIVALLENYSEINQLYLHKHPNANLAMSLPKVGITREDIEILEQLTKDEKAGKAVSQRDKTLISNVEGSMEETKDSDSWPKKLFADGNDQLRCITPDAVIQPLRVGDCPFAAALGSLAASNPAAIKKMIHENTDGTYTVTFPADQNNPVKVTAPTDAELAYYGTGTKWGTWAFVMQKAYGAYCNKGIMNRNLFNPFGGANDAEGADGGSCNEAGLNILTGGHTRDYVAISRYASLNQNLNSAFNGHRAVTAATFGLAGSEAESVPAGHDYSVLRYVPNESDPKSSLITIRNPWGHWCNVNCVQTMTLEHFCSIFSVLSYGN